MVRPMEGIPVRGAFFITHACTTYLYIGRPKFAAGFGLVGLWMCRQPDLTSFGIFEYRCKRIRELLPE
jgi:hypothetical protein